MKTAAKIFSILFLAVFVFAPLKSQGEEAPIFWVSWKALNYAPSDFQGKNLPTEGTPMEAAFELLEGGKPVNLAGIRTIWFINDILLADALGKKTVSFKNLTRENSDLTILIKLVNYKGKTLEKTVIIPTVPPELVINSPYDRESLGEKTVNLSAWPYFFNNIKNFSDFSFSWFINGEAPAGSPADPNRITLTIPEDTPEKNEIITEARVASQKLSYEKASDKISFTTK